jgi:aminoglycoside phosphotransferase (APT) family kinase protein
VPGVRPKDEALPEPRGADLAERLPVSTPSTVKLNVDPVTVQLLQDTVTRYVMPGAEIEIADVTPLRAGLSGAEIRRYRLDLRSPAGERATTSLITKQASRTERRVLAHLHGQRQPGVPFSRTLDMEADAALVCLQDVGDVRRPYSLDPITPEQLRAEARSLAAIHHANLGRGAELAWLPRLDRTYVERRVIEGWWRPHWEAALRNEALRGVLAPYIEEVEAVARRLPEEIAPVLEDPGYHTLIHADVNPSNVLLQEGRAYFVDWPTAHYGCLFVDLPHHFCSLEQAEYCRQALAERRVEIEAPEFEWRYRLAARMIGLRYLWWTLEDAGAAARDPRWVLHYIGMITAGAMPAAG